MGLPLPGHKDVPSLPATPDTPLMPCGISRGCIGGCLLLVTHGNRVHLKRLRISTATCCQAGKLCSQLFRDVGPGPRVKQTDKPDLCFHHDSVT